MFKRRFGFLILLSLLILIMLISCRKQFINEQKLQEESVNIEEKNKENNKENNKEENINKGDSRTDIKRWSQINSLEDIEEDMIINNNLGSFFLTYASAPEANGYYSLKFSEFSGITHYISIDTIDDCDVAISVKGSDLEDNFKAYLILSNGELIELLKDMSIEKVNYSLMQGDNIVALIGYKATGTFDIFIEPQEGIEIRQID